MWAGHSYTLSPLTTITDSKVKFKWTKNKQDAFKEIKRIVARNVLLDYPNFNKGFKIHTDANRLLLGAVISQDFKSISFYSIKTTDPQMRYTVN